MKTLVLQFQTLQACCEFTIISSAGTSALNTHTHPISSVTLQNLDTNWPQHFSDTLQNMQKTNSIYLLTRYHRADGWDRRTVEVQDQQASDEEHLYYCACILHSKHCNMLTWHRLWNELLCPHTRTHLQERSCGRGLIFYGRSFYLAARLSSAEGEIV